MATFQKIKYKQDMPPPGGYEKIIFGRTYPKTWYSAGKWLGIYGVSALCGAFYYKARKAKAYRNELEELDARLAIEPFMAAERDRLRMKWLRYLRDEESKVMKDVPGWKTGTWYGEPVYFTLGDRWHDLELIESQVHTAGRDQWRTIKFRDHDEWAGPKWYDKYLPDVVHDWVY